MKRGLENYAEKFMLMFVLMAFPAMGQTKATLKKETAPQKETVCWFSVKWRASVLRKRVYAFPVERS